MVKIRCGVHGTWNKKKGVCEYRVGRTIDDDDIELVINLMNVKSTPKNRRRIVKILIDETDERILSFFDDPFEIPAIRNKEGFE